MIRFERSTTRSFSNACIAAFVCRPATGTGRIKIYRVELHNAFQKQHPFSQQSALFLPPDRCQIEVSRFVDLKRMVLCARSW